MPDAAADQVGSETAEGEGEEKDYSHLFRREALVSSVDLRIDVADQFSRLVAGDDSIDVDVDELVADAPVAVSRGTRSRRVGRYRRTTGHEELVTIGKRYDETVHGGVHQKTKLAAEAIVGGAYVNTIAGPYLRLAGWTDYLVWGGWAEADVVRAELSLVMLRSHFAYAHAIGVRSTMASRLVDDFQFRTETFGTLKESGLTHSDVGSPGSGVTNHA